MPVIAAPPRFPRGPYRPPPVDPPYDARPYPDDPLLLEDPYLHPHFAKAYRRPPSPIADGSYIPPPRAPAMERRRSRSQERIDRSHSHRTPPSATSRSHSVPATPATTKSRHQRHATTVSRGSPHPSVASTPSVSHSQHSSASSSPPPSPITPHTAVSEYPPAVVDPPKKFVDPEVTPPVVPRLRPEPDTGKGKPNKADKAKKPPKPTKIKTKQATALAAGPRARRRFWPFGARPKPVSYVDSTQPPSPAPLGEGEPVDLSRFSTIQPITPHSARSSFVMVSPPQMSIPLVPSPTHSRPASSAPVQSVQLHDDGPVPPPPRHKAPSIHSAAAESSHPSSIGMHQRAGTSAQRLADLDKIDEIDETDPYGLRWHNSGPYDAIGSVLGTGSRNGGSRVGSPMAPRRGVPSLAGSSMRRARTKRSGEMQSAPSPYPPGVPFIPEALPPAAVAKTYSARSGHRPERSGTLSTAPPLQRPEDQSPLEPQAAHHAPRSRGDLEEPSGDTFMSGETHISNPRSFEQEAGPTHHDSAYYAQSRRSGESARYPQSRRSGESARSNRSGYSSHARKASNDSGPAVPVPPPHHSREYEHEGSVHPDDEYGTAPPSGRYSRSTGHYAHSQGGGHSPPRGSPRGSEGSFYQGGAPPPGAPPPEDHYYARGELDHPPGQQWHHERDSQQFYDDGQPPPRAGGSPHHPPSEHGSAGRHSGEHERRSFDQGSYGHPEHRGSYGTAGGEPLARQPSQYTQGSYYEHGHPPEGLPAHSEHRGSYGPAGGEPPAREPSQYTQGSYYEHGHAPEGAPPPHSPPPPEHASEAGSGMVYDPRSHRYVPARSPPGSVLSGGSRGGPPPRHLPRTLVMPTSLQQRHGPPSVASSGHYARGRTYEPHLLAPVYPRDPSVPRSPAMHGQAEYIPVHGGQAGRLKKRR